ncbi:MAG: dTDP-4-dehydrorhamnose 3,5-epimerase [Spirochaetota bacterium]
MKFISTPIAGCFEILLEPFSDDRGSFFRQYCAREFADNGIKFSPLQSNYSITKRLGTVRGLHYQVAPMFEAKLLRAVKGRVFDVCVDLRAGSASFGKWHAVELSGEIPTMFFLPKGCAHGFQTLSDNVEMIYFHDEYYSKEHDRTAHHADPFFSIPWPLQVSSISEKDQTAPFFPEDFGGLTT